jgi:hypothetical protein
VRFFVFHCVQSYLADSDHSPCWRSEVGGEIAYSRLLLVQS